MVWRGAAEISALVGAAPGAPPRRCLDLLPIVGWFACAGMAAAPAGVLGSAVADRLAGGLGLAVLYWWEVEQAALLPHAVAPPFDRWQLHVQYAGHVALFALMLVAHVHRFRRKDDSRCNHRARRPARPSLLRPHSRRGAARSSGDGCCRVSVAPLLFTLAERLAGAAGRLAGAGDRRGCLAGWCLAIWPKTATLRRGWIQGVRYLVASMFRWAGWQFYPLLAVVGSAGIAAVWIWAGPLARAADVPGGLAFGGG